MQLQRYEYVGPMRQLASGTVCRPISTRGLISIANRCCWDVCVCLLQVASMSLSECTKIDNRIKFWQ